jgi:hypothetical protein
LLVTNLPKTAPAATRVKFASVDPHVALRAADWIRTGDRGQQESEFPEMVPPACMRCQKHLVEHNRIVDDI